VPLAQEKQDTCGLADELLPGLETCSAMGGRFTPCSMVSRHRQVV
jgi:hypothetical protein